jgi:hypothetical protein
MTSPEVSLTDVDIAVMTLKESGGIAALSGIIRCEIALILPDGDTTLFSDFNGRLDNASMQPDMRYVGVMRKEERWQRRAFSEIAPETILRGDKLVLLDADGRKSVRPTIDGLQTRYSGYHPVFGTENV